MELVDDPAQFLAEAGPLLLSDEARHNLILGLAGTMRAKPEVYPDRSLWLVFDGGAVVGAALRTPPYNAVLARPLDNPALHELADAIDELPGVVGAVPEVDAFAEYWCAQHGCRARLVFGQGIFALRQVAELPRASGALREATWDDHDLLLDWFGAFAREALHDGEPGAEQHERLIRLRLDSDDGGIALWEDDGEVVSLCGYGSPTPSGMRIGPVYTPPELRGHGYGTTLTADVSAAQLERGRRFCFLYTDLANPTSNAIYERIGYVRVCESKQIAFEG
ncbi:MAG TPA: GNAT family N-acetyltransferase [Gaiellaceae bacterium]